MKNFGTFLILVFFFATVKSDYWSDYARSFEEMGKRLREEGRLIRERAQSEAAILVREKEEHVRNIQKKQEEILAIAELIENGNPPNDVHSNTTSLSANVNGKTVTVKSTIFSVGNDKEGAIHNIKSTYEDLIKTHWMISTIEWDGNGSRQHFYSHGGSQIITTSGNGSIYIG